MKFFLLLLTSGILYAASATAQTSYADSLMEVVHTSTNPAIKADVLRKLGRIALRSDAGRAEALYMEGLELAINHGDTLNVKQLANDLGSLKKRLNQTDSAIYYLELGLEYCESNPDRYCTLLLKTFGDIFQYTEDFDKALDYYQQSELNAISIQDSTFLPDLYAVMANLWYGFTDNDEKIIEYFTKSADLSQRYNNEMYHYIYLYNAASSMMKRYPDSHGLGFLERLLDVHQKRYSNLGASGDVNHFELSVFLNLNEDDYQGNIDRLKAYIKNANARDYHNAAISGLENLSLYFKNPDSTIFYLEQTYQKSAEVKNEQSMAFSLSKMVDVYEEKGEFKNALNAFRNYIAFSDSINSLKKQKALDETRERYSSEKKELQIASLEQENLLEKTLSSQRKTQRNGLIGGILFLMILTGFVISFFRQRLKTATLEASVAQSKITELEQHQHILTMNSMIEGQENERRRIAQDLHDGLGSLLTTIKMHFSNIQDEITKLDKLNALDKTGELIESANTEVRKIAHEMMPGSLVKLGLPEALADLCERGSVGGQLSIHFEELNMKNRLNETVEVMLFRICQELLNNIQKHAEATEAIVQLSDSGTHIELLVEDNGKGFDINSVDSANSLGLKSVNSRARFLDGKVDIESEPGTGTTVSVHIPKEDVS